MSYLKRARNNFSRAGSRCEEPSACEGRPARAGARVRSCARVAVGRDAFPVRPPHRDRLANILKIDNLSLGVDVTRDGVLGIQQPRRRGLTDEVAESIRQAIFDGSFEMGEHLNEVDIAERLEVSRGPVREALVQLRQEGIVTMKWHRGAHIVQFSASDVRELASLRTVLEVFALREAAASATQADVDRMRSVLTTMSRVMADQSDHGMIQLDMQFHDNLYRAAHHERLWNSWNSIRSQIMLSLLVKRHTFNEYYRDKVIVEHEELLQVVTARDPDVCERAIREHLSATYDKLVSRFRTADEEGDGGAQEPATP
jgi:DNA-binding GntR family transcriptional regulator